MADNIATTPADKAEKNRIKLQEIIFTMGWFITILLVVAVVAVALYLQFMHPEQKLPEQLGQQSNIGFGFLLGALMTRIFEYISPSTK